MSHRTRNSCSTRFPGFIAHCRLRRLGNERRIQNGKFSRVIVASVMFRYGRESGEVGEGQGRGNGRVAVALHKKKKKNRAAYLASRATDVTPRAAPARGGISRPDRRDVPSGRRVAETGRGRREHSRKTHFSRGRAARVVFGRRKNSGVRTRPSRQSCFGRYATRKPCAGGRTDGTRGRIRARRPVDTN